MNVTLQDIQILETPTPKTLNPGKLDFHKLVTQVII